MCKVFFSFAYAKVSKERTNLLEQTARPENAFKKIKDFYSFYYSIVQIIVLYKPD